MKKTFTSIIMLVNIVYGSSVGTVKIQDNIKNSIPNKFATEIMLDDSTEITLDNSMISNIKSNTDSMLKPENKQIIFVMISNILLNSISSFINGHYIIINIIITIISTFINYFFLKYSYPIILMIIILNIMVTLISYGIYWNKAKTLLDKKLKTKGSHSTNTKTPDGETQILDPSLSSMTIQQDQFPNNDEEKNTKTEDNENNSESIPYKVTDFNGKFEMNEEEFSKFVDENYDNIWFDVENDLHSNGYSKFYNFHPYDYKGDHCMKGRYNRDYSQAPKLPFYLNQENDIFIINYIREDWSSNEKIDNLEKIKTEYKNQLIKFIKDPGQNTFQISDSGKKNQVKNFYYQFGYDRIKSTILYNNGVFTINCFIDSENIKKISRNDLNYNESVYFKDEKSGFVFSHQMSKGVYHQFNMIIEDKNHQLNFISDIDEYSDKNGAILNAKLGIKDAQKLKELFPDKGDDIAKQTEKHNETFHISEYIYNIIQKISNENTPLIFNEKSLWTNDVYIDYFTMNGDIYLQGKIIAYNESDDTYNIDMNAMVKISNK